MSVADLRASVSGGTEYVTVLVTAIVVVAFDRLIAFSLDLVVLKIAVQPLIPTVIILYLAY